MSEFKFFVPSGLASLLVVGLLLAGEAPALGQSIEIRDGATIKVQNESLMDLEGGTMDFGPAGSAAQLSEEGGAHVTGGQLTATRSLNNPSSADPAGLGLQITASEDLGEVTLTRGHAAQTAPNGNESIRRYYDVSASQNNSGLSAELTFTYSDAELSGLAESELVFFKSTDGGSSWSEEGFDNRDAGANTATLSGIASLSRWTLGSESAPLPVELASFEGKATEGSVRLAWKTASETNNTGFEVHRQKEEGWTQIGYVDSKVQGGSATGTTSYSYTAEDLPVGTHQFRLRQVDLNGTSSLSDPVSVRVKMNEALKLTAPAPNPTNSAATVSFAIKEQSEMTIRLYNTLGQQVATVYEGTPQAGERQTARVEVNGLPSGAYFLRLRANGQTRTRRLTVVR